jgi:hypothetical protein
VGVVVAVAIILIVVLSGGDDANDPNSPAARVREAADRAQSQNNLRQIAIAMHDFNDAQGRMPPAVVYDRNGKPLYSWRVLLLPYIEQQDLYKNFHLDEAWDSSHNMKLLSRMPKTYQCPRDRSGTNTHYLAFDSPGCAFNSKLQSGGLRPLPFVMNGFEAGITSRIPATFQDGTSQTIVVAEADESVPWTKPVDLAYSPSQPLPKLGSLYSNGVFHVAMGDASARAVNRPGVSDATLRAAITAAGNDVLGPDW